MNLREIGIVKFSVPKNNIVFDKPVDYKPIRAYIELTTEGSKLTINDTIRISDQDNTPDRLNYTHRVTKMKVLKKHCNVATQGDLIDIYLPRSWQLKAGEKVYREDY